MINYSEEKIIKSHSRRKGLALLLAAAFLACAPAACKTQTGEPVFQDAPVPAQATVTTPFNTGPVRAEKGRPDTADFSCMEPPPPLQDLVFTSVYDPDDRSSSKIDPEAYDAYADAVDPLRYFETSITAMANRYVMASPPRPDIAACVQDWLSVWAEGNGLKGKKVTPMGEAVRKWSLAGIASSWAQVKDEPSLDARKRRKIENWIRSLANQVKRDYTQYTDNDSRNNNHIYWAAWAVMASGMALDDQNMFDWGLRRAERGIRDIRKDGTLDLEMGRGQRALHYHSFAAMPLFLMAETARLKGIDLYALNDSGLWRLGQRVLAGLRDPSWFAEKTGEKQDMSSVRNGSSLAWLEIYYKRYGGQDCRQILKSLRPLRQNRAGGNASLLYGVSLKN